MTLYRLLPLCLAAGLLIPSCDDGQPPATPVAPTPSPTPPTPPTPPIPPGVPANLRVSAIGTDFIEWMWDPVVGADGYEVQFRLDDAFGDADPFIVIASGQTSYRSGQLPSGTSDYLRVRSFTGAGENRLDSAWSASVTGRDAVSVLAEVRGVYGLPGLDHHLRTAPAAGMGPDRTAWRPGGLPRKQHRNPGRDVEGPLGQSGSGV